MGLEELYQEEFQGLQGVGSVQEFAEPYYISERCFLPAFEGTGH